MKLAAIGLLALALLSPLAANAVTVAVDPFAKYASGLDSDYKHAVNVTPDDTNDLVTASRAVYVGGAGTLKVTTAGGETLTITGLLANTTMRLRVTRVWSIGTTATNIVALW
jgi:hypothetical protein